MRRRQQTETSRTEVGRSLVTARSSREYRAMFGFSEQELGQLDVLDCPGGASDFAATVNARGGRAVAVDPVYELGAAELERLARSEAERSNDYVAVHRDSYEWRFFGRPEAHARERLESVERFVAGRRRSPGSYVAASLPELPFANGTFGLAVCSYLLFTYDDRLDLNFHRAAMSELLRVAAEVRVFPIVDLHDAVSVAYAPTLEHLQARGIEVSLEPTGYRFQRNADHVLVARHRRAASRLGDERAGSTACDADPGPVSPSSGPCPEQVAKSVSQ